MEQARTEYLDFAKGLGILLVIWAHINSSGPVCTFIYFFHMPLFFFISGMLFNKRKYASFGNFIQRKAKGLLLPYVVYSVVTWCVWCCYNLATHCQPESYWMPLVQTVIAQGSQGYLVHNTALWFVPCLFAVILLFYALDNLPKWSSGIVCFGLAALNILLISIMGDVFASLPWNLDTALMALPFFWCGNMIVSNTSLQNLQETVSRHYVLFVVLSLALCVFLITCVAYGSPKISMGHSYYGNGVVSFYVRAFAGIIMFLSCSVLLSIFNGGQSKIQKYIKWTGRQSFDFMSLNVPVKGFIIVLYAKLMHMDQLDIWTSVPNSIIPFLITVALISLITQMVNRFVRKQIRHA